MQRSWLDDETRQAVIEKVWNMKNLRYHFPTCYAYSVKEPIGELNLKRALDEDTGVFSFFFSLLSSSSPLGQTAVSGNSTLHPVILGVFVFFFIFCGSFGLLCFLFIMIFMCMYFM